MFKIENRRETAKGFLYPVHDIITRFQGSGEISNVQKSILDARDHQALGQHALKADVILSWKSLHGLRITSKVIYHAIDKYVLKFHQAKKNLLVNMIQKHHHLLCAKAHLNGFEAKCKHFCGSQESKCKIRFQIQGFSSKL